MSNVPILAWWLAIPLTSRTDTHLSIYRHSTMTITQVLIDGGTHGNELNGVALVEKFQRHPELIQRRHLQAHTLLASPMAIQHCQRYIDHDLNRCFAPKMAEQHPLSYEVKRASTIRAAFGPGGETPIDLCISLHGTTANMGITLIVDQLEPFLLQLAAHLQSCYPHLKVYSSANSGRRQEALRSIATYGVALEIGPVAHGTLHAELFQRTEAVVHTILDALAQPTLPAAGPLTLYQYVRPVHFPQDEAGRILAMIHPQLQFQDYRALHPGDPMLLTCDGEAIAFDGDTTLYPIFINEAAYYEKGIAMYLTQRQTQSIVPASPGSD